MYMAGQYSCNLVDAAKIHPSWEKFFTPNIARQLQAISEKIGDDFNPDVSDVLRFASFNLDSLKVVIIGQDPYPQKGVPSGRSFEVKTLKSWLSPFPQVSLKNIIRNIYRTYFGDLILYGQIKEKIDSAEFALLPPSNLFDHWEAEGVLMLNTYLTCEVGKPQSHRDLWIDFSPLIIEYIADRCPNAAWFMWGKESQQFHKYVKDSRCYMCSHPASRVDQYDFLNNPCFSETRVLYGIHWVNPQE